MSHTWLGTNAPWLSQYYGSTPQGGRVVAVTKKVGIPTFPVGDQRSIEDDKRRIREQAPKWRAQRRERAEQAFQQWKADRQQHAAQLFRELNGEDWGFPPPSHFCATLWSTPER